MKCFHSKNISFNVEIAVTSYYDFVHSDPLKRNYIYHYKVILKNLSEENIQLLSRKWYIFDSGGTKKVIEGDGVIGQQPVIGAKQTFVYNSLCILKSPFGSMYGYYSFINEKKQKLFNAKIPAFDLTATHELN